MVAVGGREGGGVQEKERKKIKRKGRKLRKRE